MCIQCHVFRPPEESGTPCSLPCTAAPDSPASAGMDPPRGCQPDTLKEKKQLIKVQIICNIVDYMKDVCIDLHRLKSSRVQIVDFSIQYLYTII